jgi:hypothetical protein
MQYRLSPADELELSKILLRPLEYVILNKRSKLKSIKSILYQIAQLKADIIELELHGFVISGNAQHLKDSLKSLSLFAEFLNIEIPTINLANEKWEGLTKLLPPNKKKLKNDRFICSISKRTWTQTKREKEIEHIAEAITEVKNVIKAKFPGQSDFQFSTFMDKVRKKNPEYFVLLNQMNNSSRSNAPEALRRHLTSMLKRARLRVIAQNKLNQEAIEEFYRTTTHLILPDGRIALKLYKTFNKRYVFTDRFLFSDCLTSQPGK